ncbi:MAG: septum formation initiator family protein [Pseudomonadales bacterium]|nr:septum formation initiator family protein [Pseudomonadales bacterium]
MTPRRAVLLVLALVVAGLQWRLWIGESSFAEVSALDDKVELAAQTNEAKRQRNKILRAEIKDLKNGYESIEEKARSDFGLIKQGETFYLLVEDRGENQGK